MTTLGSQAMKDVFENALKVVAAFKDDPVREHLHPVQIQSLEDLTAACKFVFELTLRQRQ